ncbi:hypothetical protein [Catenovulum agarivorans]|uniref:hypothetical protein n=1 Tax=Catenovulum agarivorans TaxID=1172192 RepID=UPI000364C278|nr:hypothetical protein [Catenovulum agarivorans]
MITISPLLHKVFSSHLHSFLTLKEIRLQLIDSVNRELSTEEINKIIYRQINRLIRHGIICKEQIKNSKNMGYKTTEKFASVEFRFKPFAFESSMNEPPQASEIHEAPQADIQQKLKHQLTQYEIDFQSSIAESEEYKNLLSIVPELRKTLEKHYKVAREHSNKLLGKITAVKKLIEEQAAI